MRERIAACVVFALLAGAALSVFLLTHDRVDEQVYVPPTGEARRNPLLAAERLLNELGYVAISSKDFAPSRSLPAPGDTIVLAYGYDHLRFEDIERILAWVETGGHAVLQIQRDPQADFDPVLTPLGIRGVRRPPVAAWQPEDNAATTASVAADADAPVPAPPEPADNGDASAQTGDGRDDSRDDARRTTNAATEFTEQRSRPSDAELDGRRYYGSIAEDNMVSVDFGDSETIWTIADQFGAFAGQVGYGSGALTVVADLGIMTNPRIRQGDNAFVLTRLLGPAQLLGQVWLYYGRNAPSLWQLLWTKAGFLIQAAAALLLLFLWFAAQRFGPLIPAPPVARKAFMEHIAASGRFLWRGKRHGVLLSNAQQEFLRDYARRHPAARELAGDELLQHVARVCDTPVETVHNALRDARHRGHGDFVNALAQLQTMWKNI